VWQSPRDESVTVLVPKAVRKDFGRLVWLAINGIAEDEGRFAEDVLTDLVHRAHDVLSVRRESASSTLSISSAVQMHAAVLQLVLTSGRATRDLGVRSKAGESPGLNEYVDAVRLAPVEKGSFVIKALLPFETRHRPTSVMMINSSTAAVRTARNIKSGEQSIESWHNAVELGVTSGLCAALAHLTGDSDEDSDSGDVDLRITWAWSPTEVPAELVPVTIPRDLAPTLAEGADVLRREPEEIAVTLVGQIEHLIRPGASSGPGTVRVRGMIDGIGTRTLSFDLDEYSYNQAVQAHHDRRTTIARATVLKEGRKLIVVKSRGIEYGT
jgi:hypothetical protein